MLKTTLLSIIFLFILVETSLAHDGHAHPKHNMVLFGNTEIFASHIVYKVPHNFQVILAISLAAEEREKYITAKKENPMAQFIFLLDSMEIKEIATQKQISGTVFYVDSAGGKHEVLARLSLLSNNFKVIYFDELPTSLGIDKN